jgi:release factor glutamine methyltransferase
MRLLTLPGVFAPPSDAWMLAERLRQERLERGPAVLDLCTGSGLLAIVAALEGAEVTALDVSRRAVLAARLNAALNRVRVEAIRGDLFAPLRGRRFDVIVSNPPYLPGSADALPRRGLARAWEAGASGREFLARIASTARHHLTPAGVLLVVCSSVCGEEPTLALFEAGGLNPVVVVRRRGPLGPRLSARAEWLRERGLLLDGEQEELLVIRATVATPARSASRSPDLRRSTSSPGRSPDRSAPARAAGW